MPANNTSSNNAINPAAAETESVAKPLSELTRKQREKVTSELLRIHSLVSNVAETPAHKDDCGNKAERACSIEFKPKNEE